MLPLLISLIALASPSPIPSPSPTPPSSEVQKIRQVIQEEVIKKINQLRSPNPDQTINPKFSFHGQVTIIDPDKLVLDIGNSSIQTLNYNPDQLTVIDSSRNKSDISQIKVGDEVITLGNRLETPGDFELMRLIKVKPGSIKRPLPLVIGKITDISTTTSLFTLSTASLKQDFQIKYQNTTAILSPSGQKIKSSQLTIGQIAIVVPDSKAKNNTTNSITAATIYISNFSTPSPTPKP